MSMERPKSVAGYFRSLSRDQRSALQRLRETIAAAVSEAVDGITYCRSGLVKKAVRTRLAEADAKRVRGKT